MDFNWPTNRTERASASQLFQSNFPGRRRTWVFSFFDPQSCNQLGEVTLCGTTYGMCAESQADRGGGEKRLLRPTAVLGGIN